MMDGCQLSRIQLTKNEGRSEDVELADDEEELTFGCYNFQYGIRVRVQQLQIDQSDS